MKEQSRKRARGFSLLEMTIATALGTVVLGAAVQLYSQGAAATVTVQQRAELQQDFRAAADMLERDLSLAGSGLGNNVQIALPATSTTPVYGCDQTTHCYVNGGAVAYPKQGSTPYLYGLMPGYQFGPIVNTAGGATDAVTVAYTDSNFYLNCYSVKITSNTNALFQLASTLPPNCVLPSTMTAPQNVNDAVVGLTPGDLVWFTVASGSGSGATTSEIVAEVTATPTTASPATGYTAAYNVAFSTGDVLKMNQTTAPSGSLNSVVNWTGSASRILVITYYIDTTVTTPIFTPRLMRQVSGHTPMPVAENIVFMQFSYDLYNANTGAVVTNSPNAGATLSPAMTPNQVTKINILHMSMDSSVKSGLFGTNKGYQSLDLQTSVTARDLTFQNGYPLGGS
jgi:prepilin-type N-terminal cleavage/methylation domain-containing protein